MEILQLFGITVVFMLQYYSILGFRIHPLDFVSRQATALMNREGGVKRKAWWSPNGGKYFLIDVRKTCKPKIG